MTGPLSRSRLELHWKVVRPALLLLLLLTSWSAARATEPARTAPPWWQRAEERKVGSYWIKTDVPPALANDLARHLNLMYEAYSRRLASLPQRAPEQLNVLIFSGRQDYLDVLRTRYGLMANGTGGMFFVNPRGAALAFWTEGLSRQRMQHVLQHEGFHQFAYSRFGDDLPVWLNEGLAEFFGEAVLVDGTLLIGQAKPRILDTVKEAVELGKYIPFETMLPMTSEDWTTQIQNGSASLQYCQAWSMVQFLVYGDGGRYMGPFERYLHLLNEAVPSKDAFAQAFGPGVQAFEERWKAYAREVSPSAMATAMERLEFLAEGALAVNQLGISPRSLDELREQLVSIGFSYDLGRHGLDVTLRADDSALYEIPLDDHCSDQPRFVAEPLNHGLLSRREQRIEERHPSPPIIKTVNLQPRNLAVRWDRREDGTFRYEIEVRKGGKG